MPKDIKDERLPFTPSPSPLSKMKLGRLSATIFIDEGFRPHYGPGDAVTGRLLLCYNPATSFFKKDPITADLFGPIRINVVLVGEVRIKIKRDRDMPTYHGASLFAQPFHVYDGSFKAQVNRGHAFPFSVTFPENPPATLQSSIFGTEKHALPPTFSANFSDYPDIVDVAVIYHLEAKVEMPGIDIKVSVPEGGFSWRFTYTATFYSVCVGRSFAEVFKQRRDLDRADLWKCRASRKLTTTCQAIALRKFITTSPGHQRCVTLYKIEIFGPPSRRGDK